MVNVQLAEAINEAKRALRRTDGYELKATGRSWIAATLIRKSTLRTLLAALTKKEVLSDSVMDRNISGSHQRMGNRNPLLPLLDGGVPAV